MNSNFRLAVLSTLLTGTAGVSLAAPAPVSNLSGVEDISSNQSSETESRVITSNTPSTSTGSVQTSPRHKESDIERLERLLAQRAKQHIQMQQHVDQLTLEVDELRGQLETSTYSMEQMLQRQRDLFIELDKLRTEIKSKAAAPIASETEAVPAKDINFSNNANEQSAYDSAVDLIRNKRDFIGAISAFKAFNKQFPDSKLAPNAHYWLGQLYFAQKQDPEAVRSFAKVMTFKESPKRSDAVLKMALIADRNNNPAQAQKYYQQVIEEYPKSSSANTAKDKLK
ncbi:tol-pal system protein YbgF [Vibrio sp.]|nr:tol-pal system protein YbgF [Vibrio sp.]